MHQRWPRVNRPAHVTAAKVQTQGSLVKDPRIEEPKASNSSSGNAETSEKAQKEKKKQRRCRNEQAGKESGSNRKDLSHITSFNCDQQGHYTTKCPKPKREREDSLSESSTG